jgi:hypothetical protein
MTDTQATSKELTFVECDSCRRKPGSPALCAGCLHNRTVICKLKRREGRIGDWFNIVEPVAWCDPADIAEHRISFCGVSGRMIDSNERFTMPLYAAPSASAPPPTHEPCRDAEAILEAYDAAWLEDEHLAMSPSGTLPKGKAAGMRDRFNAARAAVLAAMRPTQPPILELSRAERDVLAERRRQQSVEGWTPEHDDEHEGGALASAAACYAHHAQWLLRERKRGDQPPGITDPVVYELWPFDEEWWKPKDARRDLERAGAMILAEMERIDRAASRPTKGEGQ